MGDGVAGRVVVADLDERHARPVAGNSSNVRPSTVSGPYWMLSSSWPRLNGSVFVAVDVRVAINVIVVVGMIDAVDACRWSACSRPARRQLRAEAVVGVPDLHVADDERMPGVRADAVDAFAEIEAVQARRQWTSLSSKRTNGSVRMSTVFLLPSGCRTGRSSLKALVAVASKRKPYWPFSAATLRVKVLRLLAHQKPAPSFSSKGEHLLGQRLAAAWRRRPGCGRGR